MKKVKFVLLLTVLFSFSTVNIEAADSVIIDFRSENGASGCVNIDQGASFSRNICFDGSTSSSRQTVTFNVNKSALISVTSKNSSAIKRLRSIYRVNTLEESVSNKKNYTFNTLDGTNLERIEVTFTKDSISNEAPTAGNVVQNSGTGENPTFDEKNPSTGDMAIIIPIISLSIGAIGTLIFMKKK